MSLRTNVIASYIGQAYSALAGLVMVPVYIRFMGVEAYGLVGFLMMLQSWFVLADLGLSPSLSRQLSRFHGGALSAEETLTLVRAVEWLFGALFLLCATAAFTFSDWISGVWLKSESFSQAEVGVCVRCMGVIIGLRCFVGLYRGGLVGLERIVDLNVGTIIIATFRNFGVVAVLVFWTKQPHGFFIYQCVLGIAELIILGFLFYRAFGVRALAFWPNFGAMRRIHGLIGSMAAITGIWVIISQGDKLILSWLLDLRSYGRFTVAVTLAGGISLVAMPLCQALQPRLSVLAAQGADHELLRLFRLGTQITVAGVASAACTMCFFSKPILLAWGGDSLMGPQTSEVLSLYAIGNGIASILSLAFQAQFAKGKTHWHLIGNLIFAFFWLPGVYIASRSSGPVGAGWIWVIGNSTFLLFWVPYIHRRLFPSLGWSWLFRDILAVSFAICLVVKLASLYGLPEQRVAMLTCLVGISSLAFLTGVLVGDETRNSVARFLRTLPVRKKRI